MNCKIVSASFVSVCDLDLVQYCVFERDWFLFHIAAKGWINKRQTTLGRDNVRCMLKTYSFALY